MSKINLSDWAKKNNIAYGWARKLATTKRIPAEQTVRTTKWVIAEDYKYIANSVGKPKKIIQETENVK